MYPPPYVFYFAKFPLKKMRRRKTNYPQARCTRAIISGA
jgi:hypothetical protein